MRCLMQARLEEVLQYNPNPKLLLLNTGSRSSSAYTWWWGWWSDMWCPMQAGLEEVLALNANLKPYCSTQAGVPAHNMHNVLRVVESLQ